MGSGKKKDKWASDEDANDLLAGILDETEQDAQSEQERIQAELEAREEAKRREEQEERERKRAEAKARITAEEQRLEGLEKRRTMRQEALRIEDLKERGEYVEPDPEVQDETNEAEVAAQQQRELDAAREREMQQLRETADMHAGQPAPTAPPQSNRMPMIALAAVVALVAGAAIMAFALTQGSYEPDSSTYTKSIYEPREPKDLQVSVGFTPINKEEPEASEKPKARPPRPTPPRDNPRPATKDTSDDKDEADDDKPELIIDEDGFDPFSEGF